jgi:hypothetical protein
VLAHGTVRRSISGVLVCLLQVICVTRSTVSTVLYLLAARNPLGQTLRTCFGASGVVVRGLGT